MAGRILIVDDEENMLRALSDVLRGQGWEVEVARSGEEALRHMERTEMDIVFTDLKMPGMDGIELLERIKEMSPDTEVVVFTAYGSIESAVEAMKKGAWDYIVKPFEPEKVLLTAKKIFEHQALVRENLYLKEELGREYRFENIVGRSEKMQRIYQVIRKVAPTNANVLIYGESGTGKELIAHAIHYNSPRRDRRFVKVSCAALSQNLIETELFGHEKGSFTGAYTRRKGRFEVADGGTLFLDEVGEIPPEVQVKLLRVLQEHEFERVGGTETIKVDVRIISATNKDLWEEVRQGRFREDLFYRLNVVPIFVPPLRERKEDIPLLAKEFLKKYSLEMNKKIKKISKKAMELLMDYDWPGNVRELENTIERAVVFAKGEVITPDVLNLDQSPISGDGGRRTGTFNSSKSLYEREKSLISEVLEEANWNLARAARILQISRTTLYSKINKYGLRRPD